MKQKTVAPFSFHCVICFDAFDVDHRPPVVLPCGHTYVCEPCSKRLNKCMECRTSLFVKPAMSYPSFPPQPPSSPQPRHSRNYGGSMTNPRFISPQMSSSPNTVMTPMEQIPLPLPKNLVMISLMEAAARRNRVRHEAKNCITKKPKERDFQNIDDDEMVLDGIDSFASVCGTYIVRERHGLLVQGNNPNKVQENFVHFPLESYQASSKVTINNLCNNLAIKGQNTNLKYVKNEDSEVSNNSDVRIQEQLSMESHCNENFHVSRDKLSLSIRSEQISLFAKPFKQPLVLHYGQKVQVVDFIDGVARLARNQGFIIANRSQLGKVGEPLEKACIIEGMMNSARKTKVDLEKELEKVVRTEKFLLKDLQEILSRPEEYPVIEEAIFPTVHQKVKYSDKEPLGLSSNQRSTKDSQKLEITREYTKRSSSPVSPSSFSSFNEVDDIPILHDVAFLDSCNHSPSLQIQSASSIDRRVNGFMTNKKKYFYSKLLRGRRSVNLGEVNEAVEMNYKESSSLNPRVPNLCLRKGSADNQSNSSEEVIDYRTGLDFRTGLSCHLALNSTRKNGRRVPQLFRNEIRMMGEHRGIASIKPIRKLSGMITSPCLKSKKTW